MEVIRRIKYLMQAFQTNGWFLCKKICHLYKVMLWKLFFFKSDLLITDSKPGSSSGSSKRSYLKGIFDKKVDSKDVDKDKGQDFECKYQMHWTRSRFCEVSCLIDYPTFYCVLTFSSAGYSSRMWIKINTFQFLLFRFT